LYTEFTKGFGFPCLWNSCSIFPFNPQSTSSKSGAEGICVEVSGYSYYIEHQREARVKCPHYSFKRDFAGDAVTSVDQAGEPEATIFSITVSRYQQPGISSHMKYQ
jgi:hypothetical protein